MTHDPLTIAAFVDGELDDVAARRMAREAATDTGLATAIARERALRQQLASHYAPVIEEPLPDRLTALLTAAASVDHSFAARRAEKDAAQTQRRQFGVMQWGAMAASLALGLAIGTGPWRSSAPVVIGNGTLVASGSLADTLDTQLASAQGVGDPVRIGTSFTDHKGRYCRTFDSAALAGIGCRDGGAWQLEQTARGSQTGDYRQASAGTVATAAAAMMQGAPLDAAAERAARDKDWQK